MCSDLSNLRTEAINSVKAYIDTVELQKNARVLGEAHSAFHDEDRSPISALPKEIGLIIAKFGLFDSDSLSERGKTEVAERTFRKPAQC